MKSGLMAATAAILLSGQAWAHSGHGAAEGHVHGLESLVLLAAVAIALLVALLLKR